MTNIVELEDVVLFSIFFLEPLQLASKRKKTQVPKNVLSSLWLFGWNYRIVNSDETTDKQWQISCPSSSFINFQNDESFFGKIAVPSKRSFGKNFMFRANIIAWKNFRLWTKKISTRLSEQLDLCGEELFEELYFFEKKTKRFSILEGVFEIFWDKLWTLIRNFSSRVLGKTFLVFKLTFLREKDVYLQKVQLFFFWAFERKNVLLQGKISSKVLKNAFYCRQNHFRKFFLKWNIECFNSVWNSGKKYFDFVKKILAGLSKIRVQKKNLRKNVVFCSKSYEMFFFGIWVEYL